MRLISWNVNGIRAIQRKGFTEWLEKERPDILCLQETKAHANQIPEEIAHALDYHTYFELGVRKGYSGTGLFTRIKPKTVKTALGIEKFDCEGRIQIANYGTFELYNIYFPNGGQSKERLQYKMDFYDAFLAHLKKRKRSQKNLVICGDVNTAHKEIDLSRPKENEMHTGFLPEERAWIDKLLKAGFFDTFRMFCDEPEQYSWWDYKTKARERNIGWRIDYFFVSREMEKMVKNAFILADIEGSDHCPIGIELEV